MKKRIPALIAAIMLLAFAACGSSSPEATTPTTTANTTTVPPQGETKFFERNDLKLQITNVAAVRSEWYPFDHDDGTLEEVIIYTLYPGAQMTVLNIEYDCWYIRMDIPWEDGHPPSYVPITGDMPPMELTPEILAVTGDSGLGVLYFEWADETQS